MNGILLRIALVMLPVFCFIGSAFAEDVELRFSWWGNDSRHKPLIEVSRRVKYLKPNSARITTRSTDSFMM
jgi:hypothetical protein